MRDAEASDIPMLVELMADFDAEAGYTLNRPRAQAAFEALVGDASLGRVWLIESASVVVGYAVVTFVFAMEYGGISAFLDDFFIRPAFRDRGLGSTALVRIRDTVEELGIRAMFVEVGGDNDRALKVYRSIGFEMTNRRFMALPLQPPTHDAERGCHIGQRVVSAKLWARPGRSRSSRVAVLDSHEADKRIEPTAQAPSDANSASWMHAGGASSHVGDRGS
jgi:diamine N-acetyltransferase